MEGIQTVTETEVLELVDMELGVRVPVVNLKMVKVEERGVLVVGEGVVRVVD